MSVAAVTVKPLGSPEFLKGLGKKGKGKNSRPSLITGDHIRQWEEMYQEKNGTITIPLGGNGQGGNDTIEKHVIQLHYGQNKNASGISALDSAQIYSVFDENDIILPNENYAVSDEWDTLKTRNFNLASMSNHGAYSLVLKSDCIQIIDDLAPGKIMGYFRVPAKYQIRIKARMKQKRNCNDNQNGGLESLEFMGPIVVEKMTAEVMTNNTRPGNCTKSNSNSNSSSVKTVKKEEKDLSSAPKATTNKRMSCGKFGWISNQELGIGITLSEYKDKNINESNRVASPLDDHFGILIGINDTQQCESGYDNQLHLNIAYFQETKLDFWFTDSIYLVNGLEIEVYYEITNKSKEFKNTNYVESVGQTFVILSKVESQSQCDDNYHDLQSQSSWPLAQNNEINTSAYGMGSNVQSLQYGQCDQMTMKYDWHHDSSMNNWKESNNYHPQRGFSYDKPSCYCPIENPNGLY